MKEIITLKDASIFRDGVTILDSINWTINKGENWALIGRNGSGKSFLLKILSTMIYPSEGECRLYGEISGQTDIWELRKKIGIVSDNLQSEYEKSTTVKDVVLSGFFSSIGIYKEASEIQFKKVDEILEISGLIHLKNRFYGTLSQGEQKRVLIARALVFEPDLLILDEPTTGLDIASREEFLKTIADVIKRGHNILYVTHYIEEIIPEITHVAFLKNGKMYDNGKKTDMITSAHLENVLDINCLVTNHKNRYHLMY